MNTVIDDTFCIIKSMGFEVATVATTPGYAGLAVQLPHDSQAFFVWSKMNEGDYHFRVARFWQNEQPFSMVAYEDLIAAIVNLRILISS
jgi:hypothetical protein